MTDTTPTTSAPAAANTLAAVDLGSNSFHLLVVQVRDGRVQVLDRIKDMVRLADGLDDEDRLSEPVMRRAVACLERFGQRLRELPPHAVRVVGTSTLRRAANGEEFIAQAETALGHTVETISGREEARLIYLGVSHALEADHGQRLVVDIGGGSTELILGRNARAELMESLHVGCVGLSRRYFGDGRIGPSRFRNAVDHARQELEPVWRAYTAAGWDTAVGASGTVLAAQEVLHQMGEEPNGITPHGLDRLRRALIDAGDVAALSLAGLPAERAPVFPGGVAILCALFETLAIERMHATSGALREGVIHDLLGRAAHQDVRAATVKDLLRRFHIDQRHARRVRKSALRLLDQVAPAWRLDNDDRLLLGWAAELHEIGLDVAHSQYHKHGGYLLRYLDMPGFSRFEQRRLATLVRAHRRKLPLSDSGFDGADRPRLVRLAVLLRLAVLMHRSRGTRPLPSLDLCARDDALSLSLPSRWLRRHPLTRLDLEQEAGYLAAIPLTFEVRSR